MILGLAITIHAFLVRIVKKPLDVLSKGAKKISEGDMSYAFEMSESNEISDLASIFTIMRNSIRNLLDHKTNDIESMLANIEQGIFTINKDLTINPNYSEYLKKIFQTSKIEGRSFDDFLFSHAYLSKDQVTTIRSVIISSLDSINLTFTSNKVHLPRTMVIYFDDQEKNLELEWCAISSNDELIDRIMVTVRDMTEINKLRSETKKKDQEISMIEQLIAIENSKFLQIYEQSQSLLDDALAMCKEHGVTHENHQIISRKLHTAKGLVRTFGLKITSAKIHEVEECHLQLENGTSDDNFYLVSKLASSIQRAQQTLKDYRYINDVKLKRGQQVSGLNENLIHKIHDAISHAIESKYIAYNLKCEITSILGYENAPISLKTMLEKLIQQVSKDAKSMGKEALSLNYEGEQLWLEAQAAAIIESAFAHLVRNSLVHGIEDKKTRVKRGKNVSGTMSIVVKRSSDVINILVSDDGQGLNLKTIKKKFSLAEDYDSAKAASLIFNDGFSSSDKLSEIAGRGIGMSAVRSTIESFGGELNIELFDSKGATYSPFQLSIILPTRLFGDEDKPPISVA